MKEGFVIKTISERPFLDLILNVIDIKEFFESCRACDRTVFITMGAIDAVTNVAYVYLFLLI